MDDDRPHRPGARWARYATAATIAAGVLAFAALIAAVVVASTLVDFSLGDPDGGTATRLSIPLLFFGTVEGTFLYASMVSFAAEARRGRERLSRLFWPMFAVKVTLPATVALTALQGFDLLAHGMRPHWHVLYTPSLRMEQNLVLVSTFLSLTWLHATLLRVWGWSPRRVAWLIVGMLTCAAATVVVAVEFARLVA